MLGAEQSGNMSAVGFDLFAQMLSQAVSDAREGVSDKDAKDIEALSDISINIPGHMYLSQDYITDVDTRVLWYRRIASATTVEEVDALQSDLATVAPQMPEAALNLFAKARLKAYAHEHGLTSITMAAGNLTIEGISIPRDKLPDIKRSGGRFLSDKKKLILPLKYFDPNVKAASEARKAGQRRSVRGVKVKSKAWEKVQRAREQEQKQQQDQARQAALNAGDNTSGVDPADASGKKTSEEFKRIALITNFLRDIYNESTEDTDEDTDA